MNGVSPSWSPSGRQIAFAVGGINVINANGTGPAACGRTVHRQQN
jgi:Tol biopolymer transport system component